MHNWTYRSYLKTLRLSSKRLRHHEIMKNTYRTRAKLRPGLCLYFHVVRLNRECCPFPLFTSVTLLSSLDFNGAVQRLVYYMATIKKNKRPRALLHWFLRLLDCVKAFSCMIRRQQRVAFIIYSPTLRIFWCWFAAGASPPNSCYLRKPAGERWLHIRYGTNNNMSESHILMWLYRHANLDYTHTLKKKKKKALCVPLHLAVLWYFHLLNDLAEGSTRSNCYCGNKPNLLSKSCFYI